MKNWNIKRKLYCSYIILGILPVCLLGIISYNKAQDGIYQLVKEKLQQQVEQYKDEIQHTLANSISEINSAKLLARNLVSQQTTLIQQTISQHRDTSLDTLKNQIGNLKVGKTGYVFVLSYDGHYIVSQARKADGKDVLKTQDSNGQYVIQEIIEKGRQLGENQVDFHQYYWKNAGEKDAREKIAAIFHIPRLKWVVGVSAYFNDLVTIETEDILISKFKEKLISQKVGESGYMYIINSNGTLIAHPTSEGQNLIQHSFVKDICTQKNGVMLYPWDGQEKIAAYTYLADRDWIIVSGSYLKDFVGPLIQIKFAITWVLVAAVIFSLIIAITFARNIMNSITSVINIFNQLTQDIANGVLNSRGQPQQVTVDFRGIITSFNTAIETILRPILEAMKVMKDLAQKNLTAKVDGDYKGTLLEFKENINTAATNLCEAIYQVRISADQIAQGANQVSQASQALSQGATEQAASLEEITSSVTEFSAQTTQNASNAKEVQHLSREAQDNANNGNSKMGSMASAMDQINKSSQEIAKIVKLIDSIAFQTNLLALNAAVEAARAGNHGKGFSVVAEEVRNLAKRSAQAANDITSMIEESISKVDHGVQISQEVASSFGKIVSDIDKITTLVTEIAAASDEQAVGIGQVSQALSQVDTVTQTNTASAEESAAAAEELSGQSNELNAMVNQFVVEKEEKEERQKPVPLAA